MHILPAKTCEIFYFNLSLQNQQTTDQIKQTDPATQHLFAVVSETDYRSLSASKSKTDDRSLSAGKQIKENQIKS